MNQITIKCEIGDCTQEYPFNQTLEHRRQCCVKSIPCINKCGNGKLYKGLDAHLAHVIGECALAKVICKRCKFKSTRLGNNGHNCIVGFIGQVKLDDANSLKTALSEIHAQVD